MRYRERNGCGLPVPGPWGREYGLRGTRACGLLGAGVAALGLCQPAVAAREPTGAEGAAIERVAAGQVPAVFRGKVSLQTRVSTRDPRYARVDYGAKPGFEAEVQEATGIVARSGGRWVVVRRPITSGIGCDLPRAVATDLLGALESRAGCPSGRVPRLARDYVTGTGRGDARSFRPRTLPFGQRSALLGLRWERWGTSSTVAVGTVEYNACIPSCAEGSPAYYRVRVQLSDRRICAGFWQYRRLQFRYIGARPPGLPAPYREDFPCATPAAR